MAETKRIQRNLLTLLSLVGDSISSQQSIIKNAKTDLILAIIDCVKLLIKRKERLTDAQYKALSRQSKNIARLISPRTSNLEKKQLLQKGGFLSALLGPIAGAILPGLVEPLLGGLFKTRRRK